METISPVGLLSMAFFCHDDEAAYALRLYALLRKYLERSKEEKRFDCMSLCCIEPTYDKPYLVRDTAN